MKKYIYMITIILTMFIGANVVEAENQKINVCTYNIGNVKFVVTQKDDNDIDYVISGEDNGDIFDGYSYYEGYNQISKNNFYKNGQFNCNTIKTCKFTALKSDRTIINVWSIFATTDDSSCEVLNEYTGKLTQEEYVCVYNMTIGDNENIWLKVTYNSEKNSVKFSKDSSNLKKEIKVDKKIFLRNDKFECVPKSEIILEECLDKNSDVQKVYWKSSSDTKLYCSGWSTKYINEIGFDDNNSDDITQKTYTQGETIALIGTLYNIIKIIIPVLIIVLSIVDFLKVILISDDKNYKSAWEKFVKRLIVGIIFYLVPTLVEFILEYSGIGIEQSYTEIFK